MSSTRQKQYFGISILPILVVAPLVLVSRAYADDTSQFNHMIQVMHADRARMESQLGLDPRADPFPQATSYYDDKVAHYEQTQMMADQIAGRIHYAFGQ